jgi:hypothetical protein
VGGDLITEDTRLGIARFGCKTGLETGSGFILLREQREQKNSW